MSDANGDPTRNSTAADGVSEPLARWLTTHLPSDAPVTITSLQRPKGGYSAETWLVDALVGDASERLVLRRETPGPSIYPTQVPRPRG